VNPDGITMEHFPDGTVPLFHILASLKLPDLTAVQNETVVVVDVARFLIFDPTVSSSASLIVLNVACAGRRKKYMRFGIYIEKEAVYFAEVFLRILTWLRILGFRIVR